MCCIIWVGEHATQSLWLHIKIYMHVTYLDCTEQTITAYNINDMLPDSFQRTIVAIFIRGLTSQTSWVLRKLDQYLQLFIYCPVGPPSLVPVSTSSWKEGLEMTVNAIYEHATCSDRSSGYTTCSSGSFFIILPSIVCIFIITMYHSAYHMYMVFPGY